MSTIPFKTVHYRSAGRKKMIKEIKIEGWPTIQEKINNLPPEQRQKYEELKLEYEKAVEKADHERIKVLMSEANELLK